MIKILRWIHDDSLFDVKQDGFQTLTIPTTGVYLIEVVAPGDSFFKHPGVLVRGRFNLKRKERLTVVLGQSGDKWCGTGGTFVFRQTENGPEPLLIAGGAGCATVESFGKGSTRKTAHGNSQYGSSGQQICKQIIFNGEYK